MSRFRRYGGFNRPEQTDSYVTPCRTKTAVAGEAVAGCMIAGRIGKSQAAIPNGTFSGSTL